MSASYVQRGSFYYGTGALTVVPPSGYTAGNLFLLFVESANESIATPSGGWEEVSTQIGTGTAGAACATRLAVFKKTVASSESNVSVADSGDHTIAFIAEFASTEGTPAVDDVATAVDSVATKSLSWPSVTSTKDDCIIVNALGVSCIDEIGFDYLIDVANVNLTDVTMRGDINISSNDGGGLGLVTGALASAGASGSTTGTYESDLSPSTTSVHAYFTIALSDPDTDNQGAGEVVVSCSVDGVGQQIGSVAASTVAVAVAGEGGAAVEPTLPISLDVRLPVVVGLPIRIDIYSAVTPTLPISLGQYAITPTLPIRIDTLIEATLPSLPITIYGDLSTIGTADFAAWKARVVLDGTDISAKLFGPIDIEFDEEAAPVASFSFIPAAGIVDPLVWVSKTVRIYWQLGTSEILVYTGVVSDPQWDARDRTITISATGDLQSKLDKMDKTAIASQFGGTFSEYVFDVPENMSGYEYAVARISTTPNVLWQDAQGAIRTTSVLAKGSADFTFTESNILDTATVLRWASRVDITNHLTVTGRYRFRRRRERRKTFVFRPWQLETPSMYLSGNEGGWELPQRQQIESAANGGGWTVIGDITYTEPWPSGLYSSYSDQGIPTLIGWANNKAVTDELCIGARWVSAKRWLQTITEAYSMVMQASDSIEAIGRLATEESFSVEDEADDETWESSLDYDDYADGATLMGNGVDKKADLDEIRADFETACAVALAKASNEILKSHRETTVGFTTTFLPHIDLSHTAEVDTAYLECQGKVRRLVHRFDIDAGGATTEVEIAISRHNGSGLASSDTLDPPATPADPTEAAPDTYRQLLMHIGGQDTQPEWEDTWDGYVVNMPFIEDYQGITGSWSRNPGNPQLAERIYDEGFHILPDDIAAEYADPADVETSQTYDVEIPEDALVLVSG